MKRPSGLTLVTVVLLVLLPALAVLQYRWVGQVSAAERDRMERNLGVAAFQFRETFDSEIGRALSLLQVGAATVRDGGSERYSDRYDAWLNTALHPRMVANVYLLDDVDNQLRLRRWNTESRVFESIAWPPLIEKWRPQLEQERTAYLSGQDRRGPVPIAEDALLVWPVRNLTGPRGQSDGNTPRQLQAARPPFGLTIAELDLDYIAKQMLPELAQRHFAQSAGDAYRVAVTSSDSPVRVIYRSSPDAPTDPANADAQESLYGPDPLRFLRGPRGGDNTQLNITVNVIQGQDGTQATGRPDVQVANSGRWRLLVQHQSGSLEAAVGEVRRRNLAISFGVLLLLSVSVAMLTLSSRRAERLAQQQMEFVAGVSHELRTPVAVIKSAAENLSQGVVGGVDRVKRYGSMIEGEARRLGEMVERVLQFAAFEAGHGGASRTALVPEEIIQEAIDSSMPMLAPDNVEVHRDVALDLPAVLGDASALRSAVQNLIANAVKYGGRDKWVGIRAEYVPGRRHGDVRITVSDHGEGISPTELPHIFEPFYRGADAVAQQIHGNGLGLSLVRRIVEAHGGKVTATSRPGTGSAFTISLPAASAKALSVGSEVQRAAQA
ncbi:MAG TPA: HAMP domain-containing sensor histidine kinase [Vicinamibacterales bacterium]|nr:HAMP domain-containing sensor histidine kinase [Vicinamibacterales bacterium]